PYLPLHTTLPSGQPVLFGPPPSLVAQKTVSPPASRLPCRAMVSGACAAATVLASAKATITRRRMPCFRARNSASGSLGVHREHPDSRLRTGVGCRRLVT